MFSSGINRKKWITRKMWFSNFGFQLYSFRYFRTKYWFYCILRMIVTVLTQYFKTSRLNWISFTFQKQKSLFQTLETEICNTHSINKTTQNQQHIVIFLFFLVFFWPKRVLFRVFALWRDSHLKSLFLFLFFFHFMPTDVWIFNSCLVSCLTLLFFCFICDLKKN